MTGAGDPPAPASVRVLLSPSVTRPRGAGPRRMCTYLVADRVPAAEEHTSAVFGVTQSLEDHRPSFLFNSVMPIVPSLPERFTLAN